MTMVKMKVNAAALACASSLFFVSGVQAQLWEPYKEGNTKLDVNLDAQIAVFNNKDAWFGNDEELFDEDLNHWVENTLEIGLFGETDLLGGILFGEVSYVYSGTYGYDASAVDLSSDDPSDIILEQGYLGWRSGSVTEGLGENAVTVKAGYLDYSIATGLLIRNGGGNGGDRGAWWIAPRRTFRDALLVSINTNGWLIEAFRLENRSRPGSLDNQITGGNVEYEFFDPGLKLGASYYEVSAVRRTTSEDLPDYWTYSLRANYAATQALSFAGEYVEQGDNGLDADGYWIRGEYAFDRPALYDPRVSYRWAHFSGDDLNDSKDQGFRPTAYGFTDYGYWFQGEIAGNYPLENTNLDSHQFRVELYPSEKLTVNLVYYIFKLDQKQLDGVPLSSEDYGEEFDLAFDYEINDHLAMNITLGILMPGDAAKEATGGDDDWLYSMVYFGYFF
ncbi:MAG: alginate export family protein [Pseudomonadota bacterium]